MSFTGPFVMIDKMCEALTNWTLPEDEKDGIVAAASSLTEHKENGIERPAEDAASSSSATPTAASKESMPAIAEEDFTPDYSKLPILDPNLMSGTTGSSAPPSSSSSHDRKRRAGSIPSDRQGSQTPGRARDSDDDDDVSAPPIKDIYRARQMQKKTR